MRSLKTDLIILALIVSALIHTGVMMYMRPLVMTHVAEGIRSPHRRGPMRVVRAKDRPAPVEIETVADVRATKEAPKAEGVTSAAPSEVTANPPSADADVAALPEMPVPKFDETKPHGDALPEVRTAALSPLKMREPSMMSFHDNVKPTDVLTHLPKAGEEPAGVPSLDLSIPALAAAPATAPGTAATAKVPEPEPAKEEKEEKKPALPEEVMEKVDARVVETEKEAVRELVNVNDARDLASAVTLETTHAYAADGTYFRVKVTAKRDLPVVPKDVVILIDASGSIGKERMGSIRGAAKRILRSAANTGDRFNLVAFRDRYSYFSKTWRTCTAQSFEAADRWLNTVAAFGRTDVFSTIGSLLSLPRDPKRPLIALVVTDGEANTGVTDPMDILSKFTTLNDGLVSVYMFGVKSSANRKLIDALTEANRGESFIYENPSWLARLHVGEGLEQFSVRMRDPVLTDMRAVFATDCPAEVRPALLRNVYRGAAVEITGRLPAGSREAAFSLRGLNGATAYEGFYRIDLNKTPADPTLPGKWRPH